MKNLLLLIAIFAFSFQSFSQEDALYGIRGGINISNLDFEPDPEFSNTHRNGVAFGFFAEFNITDTFLIMPEIQFSAEGAKEKDLRLDYIQAPILLKYRISDKLYTGAGPLVGVKIHEEEDGFKNFALSGVAGFEYMITETIFIDARYIYGFTNKLDKELDIKARNTNIQIGIGVKM